MKNEPIELLREIRRHNCSGLTKDMLGRIDAALSRQAEPVCDTCHGQGEVWTGENQSFGYMSMQPPEPIMEACPECGGEAEPIEPAGATHDNDMREQLRAFANGAVDIFKAAGLLSEPAPAQDEREAFEAWRLEKFCGGTERLKKCSNAPDVYYYAAEQEAWKTWRAALATRPAQTEQQPVAVPESWWQLIHDTLRNYHMSTLEDGYGGGYPLIDAMTADGQSVSGGIEECTYLADAIWNALRAAPIAQTDQQTEQSGLVLMPKEATPEIVAAMKRELDKAPTWYCRYSAAYRAALSAQGQKT